MWLINSIYANKLKGWVYFIFYCSTLALLVFLCAFLTALSIQVSTQITVKLNLHENLKTLYLMDYKLLAVLILQGVYMLSAEIQGARGILHLKQAFSLHLISSGFVWKAMLDWMTAERTSCCIRGFSRRKLLFFQPAPWQKAHWISFQLRPIVKSLPEKTCRWKYNLECLSLP